MACGGTYFPYTHPQAQFISTGNTNAWCCINPIINCTSFTYSNWGPCSDNGIQTKRVTGASPSGCTGGTPLTRQSCTPICSYNYTDWSACSSSGTQTRTVVSTLPSGCVGTPVTTQSCAPPCTSWTYSDWAPATCPASGVQTRTATGIPAGCAGSPVTTQSCPPASTASITTPTCTDTDGGNNPNMKGTCKDTVWSKTDSCSSDGTQLTEWYCNPSNYCNLALITCSGGKVCLNGKCGPPPGCYLSKSTYSFNDASLGNVEKSGGGCPTAWTHWGTEAEVIAAALVKEAYVNHYLTDAGSPVYLDPYYSSAWTSYSDNYRADGEWHKVQGGVWHEGDTEVHFDDDTWYSYFRVVQIDTLFSKHDRHAWCCTNN